MSKAVVDPGELRRFAQDLKRFNGSLLNQMAVMQSRLSELGQSWRDQEHKKFVEQFDANMKVLVRFTEEADQYVPYLLRKAEHIDEYMQS